MASFVVVVDPDPRRRQVGLQGAAKTLEYFPGMRAGQCERGSFAASWICHERAPLSVDADGAGAAVVWGDALDSQGHALSAAALRHSWSSVGVRQPPSLDGFYAALSYAPEDGLVGGVDRLGIFPLYYWTAPEVVMLATSPAAFQGHPSFRAAFNPFGVCSILLTGGLIEGETIWHGVRRLAAGHLLTWSPQTGPRELSQYVMPVARPSDESLEDAVTRLDVTIDRAVLGQVRPEHNLGLLLSGGRDSRVVAGVLRRNGRVARALTLGEPGDHEARGGSAVAATLGFPHDVFADPLDDAESLALRHVRLEQLSNGMSNFHTWGMVPLLAPLGDRILSGYLLDALIGGTWRSLTPDASNQADGFAPLLTTLTSHGIAPGRLRRLLRRDVFAGAVEAVSERVRHASAALPGDANDRAWQFLLMHRGRHHAGSAFWRLTMGGWPVAVLLGHGLTDVVASLPAPVLVDRRAEDELLRSRFPALARLPLDRNSDDTTPLVASAAQRLANTVRLTDTIARIRRRPQERRRYYRLYDINSTPWRTIRRLAEPARKHVGDLFSGEELDALLPRPDARIELPDPIRDSNGLKALLGFLIWWQHNA